MSRHVIRDPPTFRENIRAHINRCMGNGLYGANIETGVLNYALKEAVRCRVVKKWSDPFFVQIYLAHLKSVLANLTAEWIDKINARAIKSYKIAFLTHQELNLAKWADLIAVKSKRDKQKFEVNMSAATDTFTCRKCKQKQCTYYTQQVRSADEPSTVFVACLHCGNRWKTQ